MNLSELMIERQIELESADLSILSILSFEALDSLLLSESISVESEDTLLRLILKLGSDYRDLLRHIQLEFVSENGLSLLGGDFGIPPESVWQCVVERITHLRFDSRIILDFPEILAEFRGRHFEILWLGSRDGFKAEEFHRRCDGHANTGTVILDTKGNIFGGFTPLKWHFRNETSCDDSLRTFLFTLRNPRKLPPRKFDLKESRKGDAIWRSSVCGPAFGSDRCSLWVSNKCDQNHFSYFDGLDKCFKNDTGVNGYEVLTGSNLFTVKEIEVYELN
jgi:hypothetical protein